MLKKHLKNKVFWPMPPEKHYFSNVFFNIFHFFARKQLVFSPFSLLA